jgi:hypothetical protein
MNELLINKKTKQFSCGTCGKSFHRKGFYKQHILFCENLLRVKTKYKEKVDNEEKLCIPTNNQMFMLLLELNEKYDKLNNEVKILRKYVEKTKKKINIFDWLNENCINSIDFNEWIKAINVNDLQLQNTFKNGFIDGLFYVIQQNLHIKNIDIHPIKCFDIKKKVFYMFCDKKWRVMTEKDITSFIRNINHKIIERFLVWKNENNEFIQEDDNFHDKYVQYMNIVLGGNKPKEYSYNIIINKLYNYLKCDLKNIIHFDFVF